MKKFRNLLICILLIVVITTSEVSIADMAADIDYNSCNHDIFETEDVRLIYDGDVNGKCQKTIIEARYCLICNQNFTHERTFLDDHISYIFKAVCDRATHIYYCKCKCGKGMPTIREACPRPGIGCPDMLSLGRGINVIY